MSPDALHLLEWLSKEDESTLGECHGTALDDLVANGLVEIIPAPVGRHKLYARVRLTSDGLTRLQETKQ